MAPGRFTGELPILYESYQILCLLLLYIDIYWKGMMQEGHGLFPLPHRILVCLKVFRDTQCQRPFLGREIRRMWFHLCSCYP